MSSYTTQLRTLIEKYSQYDEGLTLDERIEIGRSKLFNFDYPLFDENFKKVFETNIIREFYMREIGFETEGLFKLKLRNWLNVNMGYFNNLFETELIKYDPLVNSEMNVTHTKQNDTSQIDKRDTTQDSNTSGTSNSSMNDTTESTADNFGRKLGSDNPDSRLQLTSNDGEGVIEYASDITENNVNNKENASSNAETDTISNTESNANANENYNSDINEVEDYIQHRTGKIGVVSYSDLIMKYRNSLLRIEKMIHDELQELFMLVY